MFLKSRSLVKVGAAAILSAVVLFGCGGGDGSRSVPGRNITEKLAWLQTNAQSNGSYVLEARDDESIIYQTLSYSDRTNITITIRGAGSNRTISLSTNGSMFDIHHGITLVLDKNITLQGRNDNTKALVQIHSGGTLVMNEGSVITGSARGAVNVAADGIFTMNGGLISNNITNDGGAGVTVNGGTFTMKDGTISGNIKHNGGGGGVDVPAGTFEMLGGTITENVAASGGGGVCICGGHFNFQNGIISGNVALDAGGGVQVTSGGRGTMNGGSITGNIARDGGNGGGVIVTGGIFTMNDGIISDNVADNGGGVGVQLTWMGSIDHSRGGTFVMNNGNITNNTANSSGGGVWVHWRSTFNMWNGIISGNTANSGGGVSMIDGVFGMDNGTISANVATTEGGGVWINSGHFVKKRGTITGHSSNPDDGNVVRETSGTIRNNRGHAILVKGQNNNRDWRRENTADSTMVYECITHRHGYRECPHGVWD